MIIMVSFKFINLTPLSIFFQLMIIEVSFIKNTTNLKRHEITSFLLNQIDTQVKPF